MGLFSSTAVLDDDLAAALLTDDARTRRVVAKGQRAIRARLPAGEEVIAVAVDEYTLDTTVVVTDDHVLLLTRRGRVLQRVASVSEISVAFVERPAAGRVRLSLDGLQVKLAFRRRETADALAQTINELILERRPRTIRQLHPALYEELLTATGVPVTPTNISRLAERAAFAIGTQAGAFTAQLDDERAFDEFVVRFATAPPDRQPFVADEMIDWLWAWSPGCHRGLTRQVSTWQDGLLAPSSFLAAAVGGEIPPFQDDSDEGLDSSVAWRLVFDRNRK